MASFSPWIQKIGAMYRVSIIVWFTIQFQDTRLTQADATNQKKSLVVKCVVTTSLLYKCKTPSFWFIKLLASRALPPVRSTTSSWSSWSTSSDVFVLFVCCDCWEPLDSWLLRENEPLRGAASVRWLAGFTVIIKFELFATIMSVT